MRTLKLRILAASAALMWAAIGNGAGQGREFMDIREFARQLYIHSIPFEEANRYDVSVVPTLLGMLDDPEEQDYWSNIVVILGIIGDESTVEPMLEFIENGREGASARSRMRAKKSAVMSLGYLINKSGNQKALDYLTRRMGPPNAGPDKPRGNRPGPPPPPRRNGTRT